MVNIRQALVSEDMWIYKCPYPMTAEYITVHNTANDASAANEIYNMTKSNNTKEVSFHYAVDDIEIVQGILETRNAWHATDGGIGAGNRKSIAVEICYSKSGGEKFVKAEKNAAEFIANKLMENGWNTNRIKRHQDWYNPKYCPHRTQDLGWDRFISLIQSYMDSTTEYNGTIGKENISNTVPDIIYQVYANGKWYENITNCEDLSANGYAGNENEPISAIYANLSNGSIKYRVHTKDSKWLPWVTDRQDYAGIQGNDFDAIQMQLVGVDGVNIVYRVSVVGYKGYYSWITNYNVTNDNGYAGCFGKAIDKIQVKLVKI